MINECLSGSRRLAKWIFAAVMLLASPQVFAQGGGNSITLHVQDKPLGEVLEQIEDGYGYRFVFRNDAVDLKRKVTVSLTNVSINTVMDRILGKF